MESLHVDHAIHEDSNVRGSSRSELENAVYDGISKSNLADAPWLEEMKAYDRMLPDLLTKFENKVVAIYQGQVVANGDNKTEVAIQVAKQFGNVPVYLHRVRKGPEMPKRLPISLQFRKVIA